MMGSSMLHSFLDYMDYYTLAICKIWEESLKSV